MLIISYCLTKMWVWIMTILSFDIYSNANYFSFFFFFFVEISLFRNHYLVLQTSCYICRSYNLQKIMILLTQISLSFWKHTCWYIYVVWTKGLVKSRHILNNPSSSYCFINFTRLKNISFWICFNLGSTFLLSCWKNILYDFP